MKYKFSLELEMIIAEARNIALNSGCDYISIIHFLIADCKSNSSTSIKGFLFKNETDYEEFCNNQRIGETITTSDDIPLTKDAESVVKTAFFLWRKNIYVSELIEPYHLFLAGSLMRKSSFKKLFINKKEIDKRLEEYYISANCFSNDRINKTFFFKLIQKLNLIKLYQFLLV